MVQDLMDKKEIKFSNSIDPSINVIVHTYLSGQDNTYVDMKSPPINLSGCD